MDINFYLTFDHLDSSGANNLYYMRGFYLPSNWQTGLLIYFIELELGIDIFPYFNALDTTFPATIAEGANCYSIEGSVWTAPTDLYLILYVDLPAVGTPSPELDDIFARQPHAIYAEIPPSESLASSLPESISPETYEPNVPGSPNFYMPADWGLAAADVCWDNAAEYADFTWFSVAWNGCPEEENPWHVLLNIESFEFDEIDAGGSPVWTAPGPLSASTCNEDESVGGFYVFFSGGGLFINYWTPLSQAPALWYHNDLLGIEPYRFGVPIIPMIMSFALPVLSQAYHAPVAGWQFAKIPKVGVINQYGVASDDLPFAMDEKALVINL